jgi:hypothetical protein
VLKRRGEEYQLFWRDDRPDFVRLAAKYNALIVPFAAVGADDAYNLLLVCTCSPMDSGLRSDAMEWLCCFKCRRLIKRGT